MYGKETFIPLYATLYRSFMWVLYAGALCHGLGHFMLYVFGKCFMPGSVRDGLTRKRKRKEKGIMRICVKRHKAVKGEEKGGERSRTDKRGDEQIRKEQQA